MEDTVRVINDDKFLMAEIGNLNGADFCIKADISGELTVHRMMAMVKRWRQVSEWLNQPIKVVAAGSDLSVEKAFQRLILNDRVMFSMLPEGDVLFE